MTKNILSFLNNEYWPVLYSIKFRWRNWYCGKMGSVRRVRWVRRSKYKKMLPEHTSWKHLPVRAILIKVGKRLPRSSHPSSFGVWTSPSRGVSRFADFCFAYCFSLLLLSNTNTRALCSNADNIAYISSLSNGILYFYFPLDIYLFTMEQSY